MGLSWVTTSLAQSVCYYKGDEASVIRRTTSECVHSDSLHDRNRIRERFLLRLGIVDSMHQKQQHDKQLLSLKQCDPSLLRPSRSTTSFEQALKDDPSLSASSPSKTLLPPEHDVQVHFKPAVTVYEIPSRHDYSRRIQPTLWTPLEELQQNAARNSVEFAAENYDWKQVVHEDDMVVIAGELIHPIHFGKVD
jgi:hypothetical protein